ncbi:MAG: YbcC family protein [Planctomycetaceae bacterium]
MAAAAPLLAPAAGRHPAPLPSHIERVTAAIADIRTLVPPVWPLQDYVAVNPFQGLANLPFLEARSLLRDVRDCEMLPPASRFVGLFVQGDITAADVEVALRQCREEYPEHYAGLSPHDCNLALHAAATGRIPSERRYHTVTEAVDRRLGSSWTSHIVTDISRHCAAHYDRGQAAWPSPWKHLPLYEAWRETSRVSRRMDLLGLRGFRSFVAGLPAGAEEAVASLLVQLAIPEEHWRKFMLCELFSVAGWAAFLRYRLWLAESADGGTLDEHLVGLLAMRLAYDAALAETCPDAIAEAGALCPAGSSAAEPPPSRDVLARYLFQVAAEVAYRRRTCQAIAMRSGPEASVPQPATDRKTLQMVFCIDVRSEVIRRHLEAASPAVETFGFAGFFGMPVEFVPLGDAHGKAQCPVLLKPAVRVHERVITADPACQTRAVAARQAIRLGRKSWKAFQTSATSCFSFVESLGLAYLPKLIGDAWSLTRPVVSADADGVRSVGHAAVVPMLVGDGPDAVALEQRVALAAGMLKNLGLLDGFARIVAICGHASEVVNNPYRAGLDCGACGGHSGEPNARVAAALLNDPLVRTGLEGRGITIPADTWFVAAVHVTTTDEIRFPDGGVPPASHADDFAAVREWLALATDATRHERSPRLVGGPDATAGTAAITADILRRSRDWAEVRPEWGLANNAAFVIAPRSRTAGLALDGRTFLHSYEHAKDPDFTVLELILTAPMVVTSWINLQYYASAVDNRSFGSGNKLIHNVTGQLGVLLGNGGDLMTGLPWQSVSDGVELRHEPLRLLVLVEAPRTAVQAIFDRHPGVCDLVSHGWLTLVAREDDTFYRWTAVGRWHPERPLEAAIA